MTDADTTIRVLLGDLTRQKVDAIVNAANEHLQHGGGVAAAISQTGGPSIQLESDAWVQSNGPLESGIAAVTTAGALPAGIVVHVAGPRYRPDQDNPGLLGAAVEAALSAAAAAGARSVALPAISAGIFGYPLQEATRVIGTRCREWVRDNPGVLNEIRLVGLDESTVAGFVEGLS